MKTDEKIHSAKGVPFTLLNVNNTCCIVSVLSMHASTVPNVESNTKSLHSLHRDVSFWRRHLPVVFDQLGTCQ